MIDYIVFGDLNFDFVTFLSNDIDLNSISLDNINLDDDDDLVISIQKLLIMLDLWLGVIGLNNVKHGQKDR